MNQERLIFRVFIEVPYTIDLDKYPESDTEDGMLRVFFKEDEEIMGIVPYGDSFGIRRDIVVDKLKKFDLSDRELVSALSFFEDNNSCIDDEFFIIKYDELFQSTGQKDQDGNIIFEGDYIGYKTPIGYKDPSAEQLKDNTKFLVVWDSERSMFCLQGLCYRIPLYSETYQPYYKVIGNKIEN